MNIEEISQTHPFYEQALDLRYEYFFAAFQLPKSVTADELEPVSRHLVMTENNQLLAYGRLSPLGSDTFRISQIVVPQQYRGHGYARSVVMHLIQLARQLNAKKIQLNAQTSVAPLYAKLGFQPSANVYKVQLTGIEHIKMTLDLESD